MNWNLVQLASNVYEYIFIIREIASKDCCFVCARFPCFSSPSKPHSLFFSLFLSWFSSLSDSLALSSSLSLCPSFSYSLSLRVLLTYRPSQHPRDFPFSNNMYSSSGLTAPTPSQLLSHPLAFSSLRSLVKLQQAFELHAKRAFIFNLFLEITICWELARLRVNWELEGENEKTEIERDATKERDR